MEYEIKNMLQQILKNTEDSKSIFKRVETKVSHGFKAQGINITEKPLKDNVLNKIFIEEVNGDNIIRILHDDVTINDLKEFLENKFGDFIIISGDTSWKITR